MPQLYDFQETANLEDFTVWLDRTRDNTGFFPVLNSRQILNGFLDQGFHTLTSGKFIACPALDYTGSYQFNAIYESLFNPKVFDLLFNFDATNLTTAHPSYIASKFLKPDYAIELSLFYSFPLSDIPYCVKIFQVFTLCFIDHLLKQQSLFLSPNRREAIFTSDKSVPYSTFALNTAHTTVPINFAPRKISQEVINQITYDNFIKYITGPNVLQDINTLMYSRNSLLPIIVQSPTTGTLKAPLYDLIKHETNDNGTNYLKYTAYPVINAQGQIVLKSFATPYVISSQAIQVTAVSMVDFDETNATRLSEDEDEEDYDLDEDEDEDDDNDDEDNRLSHSHNSRYDHFTDISYFLEENGKLSPQYDQISKNARIFGIEYECYFTQPQLYGPLLRYTHAIGNGFFKSKYDGSLSSYALSREIISAPASYEAHKLAWKTFFETAGKYTFVNITHSTGGHIHFNRRTLSLIDIGKLSRLIDSNMPHYISHILFGRAYSDYCRSQSRTIETVIFKDGFNNPMGRYGALNLTGIDNHTIEVRLFKGGARYSIIMKNLELLNALFTFCETHTIKSCEWSNFLSWVSTKSDYPHLTNLLNLSQVIDSPMHPEAPVNLLAYQE